jgi:hypothetical protein
MYDPLILQFVHDKLNTLVKWDVARFFNDNPHAVETAPVIAQTVGREQEGADVATALEELAEAGILQRQSLPQADVFRLGGDAEMRTLLSDFVSACDDKDFRARAIQEVIERGG